MQFAEEVDARFFCIPSVSLFCTECLLRSGFQSRCFQKICLGFRVDEKKVEVVINALGLRVLGKPCNTKKDAEQTAAKGACEVPLETAARRSDVLQAISGVVLHTCYTDS